MFTQKVKGLILVRVTLYKLTCCLPSLKQTVGLVFQLTANKGSIAILSQYSYSPACYCSKIANIIMSCMFYKWCCFFVFFLKKVLNCPSLIVIQGSAFPGFDWFRGKQKLRSASIHKCLSIEGKQALMYRHVAECTSKLM